MYYEKMHMANFGMGGFSTISFFKREHDNVLNT